MKLLLAEDTRDLNRAVTAVLEHQGYTVDPVYNGGEALEHIKNESYDGMILDIMMPVMDGISLIKEIRRMHILTPVLLLTAKAEVDDRVTGLDAGADDYLTKPFAMKELLARIRSMTRRHTMYQLNSLEFQDITLNAESSEMTSSNTVSLSLKEFQLMETLITNADRSLETNWLREQVWKEEEDASEDTVWLYISYLKGKLRSVGSRLTIQGNRGSSFQLVNE